VEGLVNYKESNAVAWITLNRSERLNSLNFVLIEELLDALERAKTDDQVRVVVLTGAGRAFCAGGDLNDVLAIDRNTPFADKISVLRANARIPELLHTMDKITIAAINGACAGAGLSLACAADIRVASESAVFRTSFLSAGVSGDFGGAWFLTHIVGTAKARELLLMNERLTADAALDLGLVNEVVRDDALLARVEEITANFAKSAPLALPLMKRNLNDALKLSLSESLDIESERHILTSMSDDSAEAARAFLAKRDPIFKGS
jgi:2-(1,2-epoxy-1,2-dihydrophenyl)acetyl-CoA isomerase